MDNPFSILSDGDDEDDEEAKRDEGDIEIAAMLQIVTSEENEADDVTEKDKEETTFIEEGLEPPLFFTQKAYVFNQKFSQNAFFGRCYLCCYPGHSQRYCSLKYCAACDTYGHSALTCPAYPKIRIPFSPPPEASTAVR